MTPTPQVRQANTSARYEKAVLRVNCWLEKNGYNPFARVVLVSEEPRLYRLEILTKDDVPPPAGVPVLPTVDGLLEFILGMANGDVKKGGDRDARAKDWYASPMNERRGRRVAFLLV